MWATSWPPQLFEDLAKVVPIFAAVSKPVHRWIQQRRRQGPGSEARPKPFPGDPEGKKRKHGDWRPLAAIDRSAGRSITVLLQSRPLQLIVVQGVRGAACEADIVGHLRPTDRAGQVPGVSPHHPSSLSQKKAVIWKDPPKYHVMWHIQALPDTFAP